MSRTLALALGWVAPSERFTKTIERAQLAAYHEGAPEVTAEHLFSAALEDVDAVYFLARHEIPLAMLEGSKIPAGPAVQNVPRLAPPSYSPPWTGTTPHLDIPASAGLRRIVSLASALAEGRSMIEVHGGVAIEAILEDGRSQAAKTLKMAHAEVAQQSGRRLSPLPGSAHSGAVVMVQPPQKSEPRPQPAPPPKPALNSLEQVRWLKEQVARALEQERPYRFIQELSAFAGQNRPFSSMAALQLREEAQADLAVNPVYLAQGELQAVERAVEEADARVRQAALRIADVKPEIFSGLLNLLPETAAAALRAAQQARAKERAAMAAMQALAAQNPVPAPMPLPELPPVLLPETLPQTAPATAAGRPSPSWSNIAFLRSLAQKKAGDGEDASGNGKDGTVLSGKGAHVNGHLNTGRVNGHAKSAFGRLGRLWIASAGASAVS